jgi:hypothetical protein
MSMDQPTTYPEGVNLLAYIDVSRSRAGVDPRHPAVADRGKQHGDHGDEDGCDDMSPGGIADHAIDTHRCGGLNDDNAVKNQMAKFQRAA